MVHQLPHYVTILVVVSTLLLMPTAPTAAFTLSSLIPCDNVYLSMELKPLDWSFQRCSALVTRAACGVGIPQFLLRWFSPSNVDCQSAMASWKESWPLKCPEALPKVHLNYTLSLLGNDMCKHLFKAEAFCDGRLVNAVTKEAAGTCSGPYTANFGDS